jgi:YgiT-type zinc finger domain-containing protein
MTNKDSSKKETEGSEQVRICPECHAGVIQREYLTYFTWLNDELITVPNFPAWVCDICGRRSYDSRAISWLNTLLSSGTGRRTAPRRSDESTGIDRPQPQ